MSDNNILANNNTPVQVPDRAEADIAARDEIAAYLNREPDPVYLRFASRRPASGRQTWTSLVVHGPR
jgi:hypothetical protein